MVNTWNSKEDRGFYHIFLYCTGLVGPGCKFGSGKKCPWSKVLVPSSALLGSGGNFKRWRPVEGLQIMGLCWSVRGLWDPGLALSFPGNEVNSFVLPHAPSMICWLPTGSKATGPVDHGLKPLKWSQNLFLSWLSQAFFVVVANEQACFSYVPELLQKPENLFI